MGTNDVDAIGLSQARAALEDLIVEFERRRDKSLEIFHELIEAPLVRTSKFENALLVDLNFEVPFRHNFKRFDEPGIPARLHYYFSDIGPSTIELDQFRSLAIRAARCLVPWSNRLLGLSSIPEHPIKLKRGFEAECWMLIVHQLAWQSLAGSPLKARPSSPANVGHPHAGNEDEESWVAEGIPADCILSRLADDVYYSSILAARLILARLGHSPGGIRSNLPELLNALKEVIDILSSIINSSGMTVELLQDAESNLRDLIGEKLLPNLACYRHEVPGFEVSITFLQSELVLQGILDILTRADSNELLFHQSESSLRLSEEGIGPLITLKDELEEIARTGRVLKQNEAATARNEDKFVKIQLPTMKSPNPHEILSDCQKACLDCIEKKRKRMTAAKIVQELSYPIGRHGETTIRKALAALKDARHLTNCQKCKPKGYGLPGWECPHQTGMDSGMA